MIGDLPKLLNLNWWNFATSTSPSVTSGQISKSYSYSTFILIFWTHVCYGYPLGGMLQPVGRMVLNKNVDNFFNENEQLAFSPGVVPPGIYYSNDKMLQCRIFAYGDTQRHRLGPNYLLLPANAPKCAHHNNHHEGFMNFTHRDEEVIYLLSWTALQIEFSVVG